MRGGVRFAWSVLPVLATSLPPPFRFGVRNHVAHHDWICGCEVLLERFPCRRTGRRSGPPSGSLFRRCRRTKAFRIPLDFSPSSRTETESIALGKSLSFPGGWVSVREESSFVGFFPGRIPGDLPRPRLSSSGFGVCELGRSPLPVGKSLRITTFTTPSVPPKLCWLERRRVRGGTHFRPSGPGNRSSSTGKRTYRLFLSRIPG
jgi:hypothetical protein